MDPLGTMNKILHELSLSIKTLMQRVNDFVYFPPSKPLDDMDYIYLQDLSFPKGNRTNARSTCVGILKHMSEETKNKS